MTDTINAPLPPRRKGMGSRTTAALLAAALLTGAAGAAWVTWYYGWLTVDMRHFRGNTDQPVAASSSAPTASAIPAPLPPQVTAQIAALEARLAELDREAKAASGNASRAESLLIAFAARRAIERGQPLGYLENQLRLRFGATQPQAVSRIIDASTRPITLELLNEQLFLIEADLSLASPKETTWDWMKREMADLFIIRREESPSPAPENRLDRARQHLAGGRVAAAANEVNRMPGRDAAKNWLAMAQAYVQTQNALDAIENAAILQPQPTEPAPPVAAPSPSTAPSAAPTAAASGSI